MLSTEFAPSPHAPGVSEEPLIDRIALQVVWATSPDPERRVVACTRGWKRDQHSRLCRAALGGRLFPAGSDRGLQACRRFLERPTDGE